MERAVNYCRCSTEEESQRDALKIQTMESREWIQKMGWKHVDEYVEAKSGTQMKGRTEYQRLFEDMLEDKFDIIVIKDQDRLMRNTKDWYLFLDRMLQNGKRLFMYLENKYYTPDDALITGIRAIMAEEYSRTLSKKINNAHKGRQEKGSSIVINSNAYGFIKVGRQAPVINEEEAAAINRMYDLSIEGYGASLISKQLYKEGYTDRQGKPYKDARIRRIIRNPLYMGTAVMNKRHFDFETKQMIKNPPEEWIYHENIVPAIVSPDKWQKANAAMNERMEREGNFQNCNSRHVHILTHKIQCGLCGEGYYRTSRTKKTGIVKEWKCSSYLKYGRTEAVRKRKIEQPAILGCDNIHLDETILMKLLEDIRREYYSPKEGNHLIIESMLHLLEQALDSRNSDKDRKILERQIEKIKHQKDILLDKLLNEVITDEDFTKKKMELDISITKLQGELEQQEEDKLATTQLEQRLQVIRAWMENGGLEKANTVDMIADIQKIVVFPDYLDIELLPGKFKNMNLEKQETIHIKAVYPFSWTTPRGRVETEEKILSIWKERPKTTVKEISEELNIPFRAILGRVEHLKQMGKVQYTGKGGKGIWEIKDI
ncbi:MAG: recombinase family protein [Lachnospiraceae bacterium]|nr:recombinase family protein [Lachnospiraceae bacterium]